MFPTLIRFDECYHTAFKYNKQYLHQYDHLWPYLRDLYQTPGFAETVRMEDIKDDGYYQGEIRYSPREYGRCDGPVRAPSRVHPFRRRCEGPGAGRESPGRFGSDLVGVRLTGHQPRSEPRGRQVSIPLDRLRLPRHRSRTACPLWSCLSRHLFRQFIPRLQSASHRDEYAPCILHAPRRPIEKLSGRVQDCI